MGSKKKVTCKNSSAILALLNCCKYRFFSDEVIREWRKLHNEELNNLYASIQYCSGDPIEKTEMGGVCSTYWREERGILGFGGEIYGKETTWKTQAYIGE